MKCVRLRGVHSCARVSDVVCVCCTTRNGNTTSKLTSRAPCPLVAPTNHTHLLTYLLTQSPTGHSTYSLTHRPTHSSTRRNHSPAHPPTHPPTHRSTHPPDPPAHRPTYPLDPPDAPDVPDAPDPPDQPGSHAPSPLSTGTFCSPSPLSEHRLDL